MPLRRATTLVLALVPVLLICLIAAILAQHAVVADASRLETVMLAIRL